MAKDTPTKSPKKKSHEQAKDAASARRFTTRNQERMQSKQITTADGNSYSGRKSKELNPYTGDPDPSNTITKAKAKPKAKTKKKK